MCIEQERGPSKRIIIHEEFPSSFVEDVQASGGKAQQSEELNVGRMINMYGYTKFVLSLFLSLYACHEITFKRRERGEGGCYPQHYVRSYSQSDIHKKVFSLSSAFVRSLFTFKFQRTNIIKSLIA
jgi:hypothetical protein